MEPFSAKAGARARTVALSTTLVGMANIEQFEAALSAAEKGPLPPAALSRLKELQHEFVGEQR